MPAIGAVLPALSQGANSARLMSALGMAAGTVETVSEGVETISSVGESVGTISEGLSTLLEGNDLGQYPNIQRAMQEPQGQAQLEQAYAGLANPDVVPADPANLRTAEVGSEPDLENPPLAPHDNPHGEKKQY